jgi:hypothetical protein
VTGPLQNHNHRFQLQPGVIRQLQKQLWPVVLSAIKVAPVSRVEGLE